MLRKLAAALVFATGLGLLALADAPFIRYASIGVLLQSCSVRQFENLPQHMDVLVLGSSRMRRGVDPLSFVTVSDGQFTSAYNLAAPGRHLVRSAIIFDELLDTGHDVDVLVVEADTDAIRRGRPGGWYWGAMPAGRASWLDIVTKTPRLMDGLPDPRLVLRGLHEKLEQAILLALSGIAADVVAHPMQQAVPICWHPDFEREGFPGQIARQQGYAEQARRRFGNPETAYDRVFTQPRGDRARAELQLLDRIRTQARDAGVQLVVVRLQGYGEPALDPRVVRALRRVVPEFRYPPEALVRRLATMQVDGSHLGLEGRLLYTQWLTETILAEREAASTQSAQAAPPTSP